MGEILPGSEFSRYGMVTKALLRHERHSLAQDRIWYDETEIGNDDVIKSPINLTNLPSSSSIIFIILFIKSTTTAVSTADVCMHLLVIRHCARN